MIAISSHDNVWDVGVIFSSSWFWLAMQTHVKIDNTSSEHAYQQLAGFLRKRIESGEIAARLPSLKELTAETHPRSRNGPARH
jgi:hypothetical protein